MKRHNKRFTAFLMAVLMTLSIVHHEGKAVLDGVYHSAANDQLLDMVTETMPFYSNGLLYISSQFFVDTDLGVRYVRNNSMGVAVLYTTKKDLWFDLVNRTVYDKDGTTYNGSAIEKNGYVFFPLILVCQHFGLRWSMNSTATVPLLRIKSDSVVLDDRQFLDAASTQMAARYAAYEKMIESSKDPDPVEPDPPKPPPIHALEGQKVYLILRSQSAESTREIMNLVGTECKVTFLLTVQQLNNGDLLRAVLGSGHEIALNIQSQTEDEIRSEIQQARQMLWRAASSLLQLAWYNGSTDISPILSDLGCVAVKATLDRSGTPVHSEKRADALLSLIGQYREDIGVYLGYDADCSDGLSYLLEDLLEAKYRLCAWRLNACMD